MVIPYGGVQQFFEFLGCDNQTQIFGRIAHAFGSCRLFARQPSGQAARQRIGQCSKEALNERSIIGFIGWPKIGYAAQGFAHHVKAGGG